MKYRTKKIEKIYETKSWFLEMINTIYKPLNSIREKKRLKSIKSEMKEKLQRILQKHKILYKNIMKGYMPPNSII